MILGRILTTKRQQKSIFFVKFFSFFRQVRSFGDGRRQTKKSGEKAMRENDGKIQQNPPLFFEFLHDPTFQL